MKNKLELTLLLCLFISVQLVFSQEKTDAYKVESDGYFVHPVNTTVGVIATDNLASKIYLIQNNKLTELISTTGCGRYFTVSADKSKIGFKLINADGTQLPAIYDISKGNIFHLTEAVKLCGQPSFSNNSKVAFTIGNEINVTDYTNTQKFDIGVYSNITPISPDGNYVIYNNDKDQLLMIDLTTRKIEQITDNNGGYAFPQWSPDGNKLSFSTLSGNIMIWDKSSGKTYSIGAGENVSWSDDSQFIIFNRNIAENFEFKGSDIFIASFDGSKISNITNTPDVNEIAPTFGLNNSIIYSTFDKKQIISATLDSKSFQVTNKNILITCSLQTLFNSSNSCSIKGGKDAKSIIMVQGNVPYIHQKYDTPDWHNGSGSCAPTTAAMALAYYNRLPYWDITCCCPYSHTSHYGSYVADMYRYNGTYYNLAAIDEGGVNNAWGGYGFMWNGSNKPSNIMNTYIQNHNVTSIHDDTTTFAGVKAEINKNYPYPLCNTLSTSGHLILTVGYMNGQHTLIFNDPYGNKDSINTIGWPNYYGKNSYYDWPGYNNGFQNLNSVAWTVTAEAVQPIYNDTIIDDVNYNHGFYMYNKTPSHMKYFQDSETGGYGTYSHFWWTYTTNSTSIDTCYVKWTPTLSADGDYEVFAYIPNSSYATATTAQYKVHYSGGNSTVVINQSNKLGQWVSLGIFPFYAADSGYVRVGDGSGILNQKIAFDAVKWDYVGAITSVDNKQNSDFNLRISPNPTSGNINISLNLKEDENIDISLFDKLGKELVLFPKTRLLRGNFNKEFNTKKLDIAAGTYIIKITGEKRSSSSQLVVLP